MRGLKFHSSGPLATSLSRCSSRTAPLDPVDVTLEARGGNSVASITSALTTLLRPFKNLCLHVKEL